MSLRSRLHLCLRAPMLLLLPPCQLGDPLLLLAPSCWWCWWGQLCAPMMLLCPSSLWSRLHLSLRAPHLLLWACSLLMSLLTSVSGDRADRAEPTSSKSKAARLNTENG